MSGDNAQVVASVAKVTTLADNGLRVTFDLPEDAVQVAAWLMECKQRGVAVAMAMVAVEIENVNDSKGWTKTTTLDVRA